MFQKDDDASSTKSGSSNNGSKKYTPPPIPIPVLAGNPLHTLAEAAKVLNPVQFELPKDLACTTPLPGKVFQNHLIKILMQVYGLQIKISEAESM